MRYPEPGRARWTWWVRYAWAWLRASRKERAMAKMLSNLLANAPMDKIRDGESCSWSMTPDEVQGTMHGCEDYVAANEARK